VHTPFSGWAKLTPDAAVAAAEALAAGPPLDGDVVLLDTMPADEQMQPTFVDKVYTQQGNPAPAVSTTWLHLLRVFHIDPEGQGKQASTD